MKTVTTLQKIYLAFVASFALWVGFWGYFVPSEVDRAIPWLVPPLHARFLGSLYLSATVFLVWSLFSKSWAEIKIAVTMVFVWTGWMLIVSCLHLEEFNYHKTQVWFWFGAYVVYPIVALGLIWSRHGPKEKGPSALSTLARLSLFLQGVLLSIVGLSLFFFPKEAVTIWPWKVTSLLTQLYSAPFLAYGIGSFQMCRQKHWSEIRIPVIANFVFAACVLTASLLHRALFSSHDLSDWIWFIFFSIATGVLGRLAYDALKFTQQEKFL